MPDFNLFYVQVGSVDLNGPSVDLHGPHIFFDTRSSSAIGLSCAEA